MIDEVEFIVKAGDGGNGRVSFRREKYVPKGGPDGGDGGRGGSIYLVSSPHFNTLRWFAGKAQITAPSGGNGGSRKSSGANGTDIMLQVPLGTLVYADGQLLADLAQPDQRLCLAQGGQGGRGNTRFKSATNQTPRTAEPGQEGDARRIRLELKLLAHVGLIGLPNAGKSTLLSVLTAARPKVANYPFTTISPNLGVMDLPDKSDSLIIADIPGIIEGASQGKGLGIKFLKHIERCRVLVYLLAPDLSQDLDRQFHQLQNELKVFNPKLLELPSLTVINKLDLLQDDQLKTLRVRFKTAVFISAATHKNLDQLKDKLARYQPAGLSF